MAEAEHQAVEQRKGRPNKSLKYPERQAIKVTTEKWRRFIDFLANDGCKIQEALDLAEIARESYNVFVLTDQAKKDQVADARVTYSRRFWDEETLEAIWIAIADGSTVRDAVFEHASPLVDNPINSFYALCTADVTVADSLKAARRINMENMADEILQISDDDVNDVIDTTDKNGNPIKTSNPSAVRRAETKIRTRQWLMSKIHSDQYGDRPQVEINNNVNVNHVEVLDNARRRKEQADERKAKLAADPSVVSEQ
jgi:hypothetical protein